MNPPGGGAHPHFLSMAPLWHPPVSVKWMVTGIFVFAGAVAPRLNKKVRRAVLNPVGFFIALVLAIGSMQYFPPATFAILFFLLCLWVTQDPVEGFLSGTIDWVTNSKKWWVERVMNECPLGIQEKDVQTYPVSD